MEYKRICSAKLAYKFRISKVSFWWDDDMIFQTEGRIRILHKLLFSNLTFIGKLFL